MKHFLQNHSPPSFASLVSLPLWKVNEHLTNQLFTTMKIFYHQQFHFKKNQIMKQLKSFMLLLVLLCAGTIQITYAQTAKGKPTLQQRYDSYGPKHEVTFDQFLKANSKPTAKGGVTDVTGGLYTGCDVLHTACGNGDFENGLDTSQWEGADYTWGSGTPDPFQFTQEFISGDIYDFNAHQTVVSTGTDPNTGISTTNSLNPNSTKALRLGNAYNSYGTELISKNIQVTNALTILTFYYALVMEDPQHDSANQPAFFVRVFDCATGQELSGVCDLGNGSNRAVADRNNPFFQCATSFCDVIYRNWTRAQIDLSQYVGKTVNVMFMTKDCGLGGHYGYAYLDDVCGTGNTTPTDPFYIVRNLAQTDSCGQGEVCVDYVSPKVNGNTGTTTINMKVYQSGNLITTLTSGTLTADSSTYCFDIDPSTLGIDTTLAGFDYTVTGNFAIGGTQLSPQTIGNPPDGQVTGANNDYYTVRCPNQNSAPVFDYPPTPADGTTYNVTAGGSVNFNVKAEDSDAGDVVTITASGVPAGATTSFATGNPANGNFNWTTTSTDTGSHVVQFTATDNGGLSAITSVIINVNRANTCDSSLKSPIRVIPTNTVAGAAAYTIFKGYGPQYVILVSKAQGGTAPYKYKWDNGSVNRIRYASPDVTTTYTLTVTDAKGCSTVTSVTIYVRDVRGRRPGTVLVCLKGVSISVPKERVPSLLSLGATLGHCSGSDSLATASTSVTARSASSLKVAGSVAAASSSAFTVYPNPAKTTISLSWSAPAGSNAKVVITDMQGRTLMTQSLSNSPHQLSISQLVSGVYMAKLVTNSGTIATTRFVVSK